MVVGLVLCVCGGVVWLGGGGGVLKWPACVSESYKQLPPRQAAHTNAAPV